MIAEWSQAERRAWKWPESLKPSQWAEANRILPSHVTAERRKSCRRQSGIGSGLTPDAAAASARALATAVSIRLIARLNPEMGVLPLVVSTRSQPANRGRSASMARASGAR